jgi:hypothetical protein
MPRVWVRAAGIASIVLTAAAIWVAPAGASRAANGGERRGLTQAVHSSRVGGLGSIPESHYQVTGERISTVSRSWATARLVATPPFRSTFQNATMIAVRPAGTAQWVVVDLGTAQVGCGIAPDKVLADLFKTKLPCPPGEGIG